VLARKQLKILDSIIKDIPVNVMNALAFGKQSPKVLFHNVSVFKNVPLLGCGRIASFFYEFIAVGVEGVERIFSCWSSNYRAALVAFAPLYADLPRFRILSVTKPRAVFPVMLGMNELLLTGWTNEIVHNHHYILIY
jgi:hypothetical protein